MVNEKFIQNFTALISKEKQATSPNTFRIRSYQKVVKIIAELKKEIISSNDVAGIPGIGAKTIEKINTILEKGQLDGLDLTSNQQSNNYKTSNDLESVTGIGAVKAKKLIESGWTLEKLRARFAEDPNSLESVLTHHQRLGIKYYTDLENRIPYAEIQEIEKYIAKRLEWINKKYYTENEYQFQICGSYRRKKETSGDIDILFYNSKQSGLDEHFLGKLLGRFKTLGFIKDSLTDKKITTKYMGFCKLTKTKFARRIDMRCIDRESFPCALLYFTGSGEFNKNMRSFANRKGYTINEYGVFKLKADGSKGKSLPVSSEEEIFTLLGKEYIAPENRLATVKF